jgi:hypothetical protein
MMAYLPLDSALIPNLGEPAKELPWEGAVKADTVETVKTRTAEVSFMLDDCKLSNQ